MDSALVMHRLQFAFTITYHYLFPQLTMGLAPLLVLFKTLAIRNQDERWNQCARYWGRIFAINFLFGVVTGIPMEFQFGTNWARFSRYSGGVIGTSVAMEGVFAFFLESSFLGIFLFGEKRFGQKMHWLSAVLLFLGSWLSGYFIVATNAWMQHPVGYELAEDGSAHLTSFGALLFNEWALWQYAHTMGGAVVTGAFTVAGVGAFHVLSHRREELGRLFLRVGVIVAALASFVQLWPTGDTEGRLVTEHQPVTLAAMEGLFHSESGAPILVLGQPNTDTQEIENPLYVPKALSFLTHRRWDARIEGLEEFPRDCWPDNIALLFYCYHIMVGLGTIFIAVMAGAVVLLWMGRLYRSRWMLWIVMLCSPFPFIANTAGWITAEVGRQPWVVYGLMRTNQGYSHAVSAGDGLFTLLGFMGMYTLLGIVYLVLMWHEVLHGPQAPRAAASPVPPSARIMPETAGE